MMMSVVVVVMVIEIVAFVLGRIDDAKPKLLIYGSCGIERHHVVAYGSTVAEALRTAQSSNGIKSLLCISQS